MKKRKAPSRTQYSRAEAPLGAVRERDAGNGQMVRMVKIRMDGPPGARWIPYARWWWEQNRGPVPKGKRVCHADGDLLNDDPQNLVLLTPGQVISLYHRLDPEMSRRNHVACGAAAARRNRETARLRRQTTWLPYQWYAVDFGSRVIHDDRPRRKRWMVYAHHGFADRLAARLKEQASHALAGDTAAAAYVVDQVSKLRNYWRWIRSASLGWPGITCMTACIMHVLAAAGHPLWTCELLEQVTRLRTIFDWAPHELTPRVLHSCASAARPWIHSAHEGRRMKRWSIGADALAARIDGPRIVAVRGRNLSRQDFNDFSRASAAPRKGVAA